MRGRSSHGSIPRGDRLGADRFMAPHGIPWGARVGVSRARVSFFTHGATPRARSVLLAALACVVALAAPPATDGQGAKDDTRLDPSLAAAETALEGLRADAFLENAGQLDRQEVRFYAASGNVQVGFADSAVLLALVESPPAPLTEDPGRDMLGARRPSEPTPSRGVMLRLSFEGANEVVPRGRDPLSYPSHFFLGNDPARWRTNVRSYREIVYEGLYEGVDLVYRASASGVKYEFHLAPGADPGVLTLAYEGAEAIDFDGAGNLWIRTALADFTDSKPIAYQGEHEVSCVFVLRSPLSYGFDCDGVDSSRALVIDPLIYSTFLGGDWDVEWGTSMAVDAAGNAYVTGNTWSLDFPATPGAFDTNCSCTPWWDGYVAKLDPTGTSLFYATFLGGGDFDFPYSIAVDAAGNAYVTGSTYSIDFPVTPGAFNTTHISSVDDFDSFVTKLDPSGSSLRYSTYLGGTGDWDEGYSIAADAAGSAYVTGNTDSWDFPVTAGAYDTSCGTDGNCNFDGTFYEYDAFVTKLDPSGSSLLYSTYLGGTYGEQGLGITVDAIGNAYVTGATDSLDFPTTPGALDTTYIGGPADAFVAKLDPTGSGLLYSTFLGGASSDFGWSVGVDAAGNAYVAGATWSADFPVTPGAFDTTNSGPVETFVAKLDPTGSSLLYATYLARTQNYGLSVAVDSAGNAYVAGTSNSVDVPVTLGAFDVTLDGSWDGFLGKLNPSGSALLYATYLGGGGSDRVNSVAVDAAGNAYVAGWTNSTDFPVTPGAFKTTQYGYDAFVAKLNLTPEPTSPVIVSAALTGSGFQDLSLTWTPAPLDGSPGGPTEYRVLHAPALGGPFTEIASISATGSPSYSFTCPACGHVPGETNTTFYRVRAVSANATTDSNLAARYAKAVQAGPHLLAVPLEQAKYAIPAVLQTLTHGVVRTFRAADAADPWKAWHPARPGDLATLAFGDAMWVDVTAAGQYTVAGLVRLNPIVPLSAGWNLVGYAAFVSETRDVSLAEAPGVVRVEAFDPASADPYRLRVVAGTEMLVPGEGFWVLLVSGGGLWVQG